MSNEDYESTMPDGPDRPTRPNIQEIAPELSFEQRLKALEMRVEALESAMRPVERIESWPLAKPQENIGHFGDLGPPQKVAPIPGPKGSK